MAIDVRQIIKLNRLIKTGNQIERRGQNNIHIGRQSNDFRSKKKTSSRKFRN